MFFSLWLCSCSLIHSAFFLFDLHPQLRETNRLWWVESLPLILHVIKAVCASGSWDQSFKGLSRQAGTSHMQTAEQCHHEGVQRTDYADTVRCMQTSSTEVHFSLLHQEGRTWVKPYSVHSVLYGTLSLWTSNILLCDHYLISCTKDIIFF